MSYILTPSPVVVSLTNFCDLFLRIQGWSVLYMTDQIVIHNINCLLTLRFQQYHGEMGRTEVWRQKVRNYRVRPNSLGRTSLPWWLLFDELSMIINFWSFFTTDRWWDDFRWSTVGRLCISGKITIGDFILVSWFVTIGKILSKVTLNLCVWSFFLEFHLSMNFLTFVKLLY